MNFFSSLIETIFIFYLLSLDKTIGILPDKEFFQNQKEKSKNINSFFNLQIFDPFSKPLNLAYNMYLDQDIRQVSYKQLQIDKDIPFYYVKEEQEIKKDYPFSDFKLEYEKLNPDFSKHSEYFIQNSFKFFKFDDRQTVKKKYKAESDFIHGNFKGKIIFNEDNTKNLQITRKLIYFDSQNKEIKQVITDVEDFYDSEKGKPFQYDDFYLSNTIQLESFKGTNVYVTNNPKHRMCKDVLDIDIDNVQKDRQEGKQVVLTDQNYNDFVKQMRVEYDPICKECQQYSGVVVNNNFEVVCQEQNQYNFDKNYRMELDFVQQKNYINAFNKFLEIDKVKQEKVRYQQEISQKSNIKLIEVVKVENISNKQREFQYSEFFINPIQMTQDLRKNTVVQKTGLQISFLEKIRDLYKSIRPNKKFHQNENYNTNTNTPDNSFHNINFFDESLQVNSIQKADTIFSMLEDTQTLIKNQVNLTNLKEISMSKNFYNYVEQKKLEDSYKNISFPSQQEIKDMEKQDNRQKLKEQKPLPEHIMFTNFSLVNFGDNKKKII